MKIEIIVNEADFEYDIFGLVQAFYPREEIEIPASKVPFFKAGKALKDAVAE